MARSYNKYRWRAGAPLYKVAAGIGTAIREYHETVAKEEYIIPKKNILKKIWEWFFK